MSLPSVGTSPIAPVASPATGTSPVSMPVARKSDDSFTEVMQGLLNRVNQPHTEADAAVNALVQGKSNDVHDVVLTMVKADLSFRLALEVRNRLTEAYQEIMRMQV